MQRKGRTSYWVLLNVAWCHKRNKETKKWNRLARIIEMKSIHTSWANIAAYFVISTLLPFTYQTNRFLWFIESPLTRNGFGWNNLVWKREEKGFGAISCWYVCYHLFYIFLTALLFLEKEGSWDTFYDKTNLFKVICFSVKNLSLTSI